jgi:large subunit ribosomal protein L19
MGRERGEKCVSEGRSREVIMDKLMMVEKELLNTVKKDYPEFNQGDIIKVYYKIKEKERERIHPIEGIVIRIKGAMHRKSFCIRRTAYGESYEVTFPYYSPNIEKIEVIKKSHRRPRRKKLYYLRERVGKKAMLT